MLVVGAAPGPVVEVLTLGAALHTLTVTCGDGVRRNVALGHRSVEDRLASPAYVGATVGRYANRIAGASFELDGREVRLAANEDGNSLHGGPDGFDRRLWEVVSQTEDEVVLELVSPDGDQGFPGTVTARVAYQVDGDGVTIELTATTDAPTVVNLTHHAYLNLDGQDAGTVDDHVLEVPSDHYLPVLEGIPTGIAPVDGTPFDLRAPTRVGQAARSGHEQVAAACGLDHCLAVRGDGLRRHATLSTPTTSTRVELWSDQPGLQVFTANFDAPVPSLAGGIYRMGDGLALEPQLFPDTPHHPQWPSAVLRPGETYRSRIEWRFA
ncbi:aldose 1-epimerase [Marmoricola bigeumensis]|uniref:Aldose 1-epimerase n=1 Tax=Nocardioides marmoribigeumensis TaxID=433649 RepID=A0ABU2BW32_9ACTN|nr:aldose 1-epimerase [Nocardioides marmoribigeumensis]